MANHTEAVQIQHEVNFPPEHVTVMWGEFGLLLREKHFLSKVEVVDESDGVRVELRILRTEQGALMDIFNWSMLRRAQ